MNSTGDYSMPPETLLVQGTHLVPRHLTGDGHGQNGSSEAYFAEPDHDVAARHRSLGALS
jgi:hypothetical protein